MANQDKQNDFQNLPPCAAVFIGRVIKKMRYRKKVRQDVQAELVAHFEDGLKDCTTDHAKEQAALKLIADFGDIKLLALLLRRAKKRCRPLWRKVLVRSLQMLGVIFLYVLLCFSPLIVGTPRITVNYLDWLNELVRQGRDEADNAKPYYEKAIDLYVAMPELLSRRMSDWPADLNDVELDSLSTWLKKNEPAIGMFTQGADRPYYWNTYQTNEEGELATGVMQHAMAPLASYKRLAQTMSWRIRYDSYNGDTDSALRNSVALLGFGRHLQGHGLMIEQLVGIAIEALAHNEVSTVLQKVDVPADALETLQKKLQKLISGPEPVICLEAEKAFWYDQIQRTFTNDSQGSGRLLVRGIPYVVSDWKSSLWSLVSFSYPDRREVVTRIDTYFEQAAEFSGKTPCHWHTEGADSDVWNKLLAKSGLMLQIAGPAHRRMAEILWRLKTDREALLTVLALMRYQKKIGRYPTSLDEVGAAGYLEKLPMDPYGDKPLIYEKTKDSFVLYSIGLNFKDDGGEPGKSSVGRLRKWSDNGDTVFWPAPKIDN